MTENCLSSYVTLETLFESTNATVVRAQKEGNNCIIKFPRDDSPKTRTKFLKEQEIAKLFDSTYILKCHAVEKYKNSIALVLEDFGGIGLLDYIHTVHKVNT